MANWYPILDKDGKTIGIEDSITHDLRQSTAPNPTQVSLDAMLAQVTRFRVIDGGMVGDEPLRATVLLDTYQSEDLVALRACLRIREEQDQFFHCMCLGQQVIECYGGQDRLAAIALHHGRSIRWNAWKWDALLVNGQLLVEWLAGKGVAGPKREVEAARLRAEEQRRAMERWREAMPPCLQECFDAKPQAMSASEPMVALLEQAYPDAKERALAVLRWFGHGEGPWSGFPGYERVAEDLLRRMPIDVLLAALDQHPLDEAQLEGAARLFASSTLGRTRAAELTLLPDALKAKLLAHSMASSDADKRARASHAFAH